LLELLQVLQISLFAVSVLGLLILGLSILFKTVLILPRRLFLLIFLPLLLATPLARIEGYATPGETPALDWRLGLVLVVDLGLIITGYWVLNGWLVYGLSEMETDQALKDWFSTQGWSYDSRLAERSTLWGGNRQAKRLEIHREGQTFSFWLLAQGSEVRLEGEPGEARKILRQAVHTLARVERAYHFQDHTAGILYIVLAIVLAVLGWIFFFEPRLILID